MYLRKISFQFIFFKVNPESYNKQFKNPFSICFEASE
jgi:hypothetical protein